MSFSHCPHYTVSFFFFYCCTQTAFQCTHSYSLNKAVIAIHSHVRYFIMNAWDVLRPKRGCLFVCLLVCFYVCCMMVLRPALLSLWMDITASAWHDVGSMTGVESVIYLCDFSLRACSVLMRDAFKPFSSVVRFSVIIEFMTTTNLWILYSLQKQTCITLT